jgi:hypothetical protein
VREGAEDIVNDSGSELRSFDGARPDSHQRYGGLESMSRVVPPSDRVDKYEAAAILHCEPRTVVDLARSGQLPTAAKLTREWSFDATALRDYVRAREAEACRNAQRRHLDATGEETRSTAGSRSMARISAGRLRQTNQELRANAARLARNAS